MGVYVAEYFGQRADIPGVLINPEQSEDALCPFMNGVQCKKLAHDKKPPVCAVRKTGSTQNGMLWISCSRRLCASERNVRLSDYQIEMLFSIAKVLYGNGVEKQDVCVKAEEPIQFKAPNTKPYRADYIFAIADPARKTTGGPSRLVVEMQGGGETSNTKLLTDLVKRWENNPHRINALLTTEVKKVGTLETNAWRRQQEQFLVKGSAAKATDNNYGIAFCVGKSLFDYIENKIGRTRLASINRQPDEAWTLAIVPIIETVTDDPDGIKTEHSIPLKPDLPNALFMDYNSFVNALVDQGGRSNDAFSGSFHRLDGTLVDL